MNKQTYSRAATLMLLSALGACESISEPYFDNIADSGGPPPADGSTSDPGSVSMDGFGVDLSDPNATYTGTLRVLSTDGMPVAAMLRLGEKSYFTDDEGKVAIPDLPAGKTLRGRILGQGFAARGVKLSYAAVGQAEKRVVLEKIAVLVTFDASEGAAVDATSTRVSFPPNAFLGADGKVFEGNVVVAAGAQDPASLVLGDYESGDSFELRSDFDFDRVPDGYLFAKQADGSVSFQYPESVFSVDIADEDGNALAINPSATPSFGMRLPSITQRLPGDVVEVFTFDEEKQQWVADGTCTVQAVPGGLECAGEAKHFSSRSMPVNADGKISCYEYRVVRRNFPTDVMVKQWSESQAGTTIFKAEINELNSHGLCHLSAQGTGRVVLAATSGSETKLFESAWDSNIPGVTFGDAEIATLDAQHECPACVVRVVVADWNKGSDATDVDGDGYYAGAMGSQKDCDDNDKLTHPGAAETYCDTKDLNCDGKVPPGWTMKTRAEAASAGVTVKEWNAVCEQLDCLVPDEFESRTTERTDWDDNCDGSLNCPPNTFQGSDGLCKPPLKCADAKCSPNAACTEADTGATCKCNDLFMGDGKTCSDINECLAKNGGCGDAALYSCTNNVGAAPTCADINECATNNGGCGDETFYSCTNSVGAAPTCADIDECLTNNGGCGNATFYSCTNNVGAAPTCADIDECATNKGGCVQTCNNTPGSFSCGCNTGYTLNADGKSCDDIDECTADSDGCAQTCTNNAGAFICSCGAGYALNADGKACDDINECANSPCTANGTCTQQPAGRGYTCRCAEGYSATSGTAPTCQPIDACDAAANRACGTTNGNTCVDDAPPSTTYQCECGAGYVASEDGKSCASLDACVGNPCAETGDNGATCQDFAPPSTTYSCTCSEGFVEQGGTCVQVGTCLSCNSPVCCELPECSLEPICGGGGLCIEDGNCNPTCGPADPDCMIGGCFQNCSQPGCCEDPACSLEPECNGGGLCIEDGFCEELCGSEDPDCIIGGCAEDCAAPGCCEDPACEADPFCSGGGLCIQDAFCDEQCGLDDPDCVPNCAADNFCNQFCGPSDPDCSGGGPNCASDCAAPGCCTFPTCLANPVCLGGGPGGVCPGPGCL